ncbi:MAG: methionyl-tRNA formyltransferase, partial [Bacillota bacterium]|nr:methionyl-tRNA formyltransferase [Bacillota bacterium]
DAEATYAVMLTKEHEQINWQQTAEEIVNHVRGMNPWPGAYTIRKGTRVKVYEASIVDVIATDCRPGEVIAIDDTGIIVKAREKAVKIINLQPAGKRIMAAQEYLRGSNVEIGEILESS